MINIVCEFRESREISHAFVADMVKLGVINSSKVDVAEDMIDYLLTEVAKKLTDTYNEALNDGSLGMLPEGGEGWEA